MAGPGELPSSTTRRVISGSTLPVDPQQTLAFLKACYVVTASDHEPWLAAALRAFQNSPSHAKDTKTWAKAHDKLRTHVGREATSPPRSTLRSDSVRAWTRHIGVRGACTDWVDSACEPGVRIGNAP